MKRILCHSKFMADPFGHGGERRSAQIQEFYKNNGYEVEILTIKSEDPPNLIPKKA